MEHCTEFSGQCYRLKFVARADDILGPAQSPEGRAHYDGQKALYLSTSKHGTVLATRAYWQSGDPARAIFPLWVEGARVIDLRDPAVTDALGIDPLDRTADWQNARAKGLRPRPWDVSDRVRSAGVDGMLYASKSTPNVTHLTLFRWNDNMGPKVSLNGDPSPVANVGNTENPHPS